MSIDDIKKRLQEIVDALNDPENTDDTEALKDESRKLTDDLKKLQREEERKNMANDINNGIADAKNITPAKKEETRDYTSTLEYRNAFMKYVLTGKETEELRASETTKTTDIGAVIPSNIMNKIYEKLETIGKIYAKVTKTNFKGGVTVPTSSLKPTAVWVAEGSVADTSKKTVTGIVFAYHKLQVRVAISLEADTVALATFETAVENNCSEAMVKAVEKAIFLGTGSGEPTGIATKVTATTITAVDYATLSGIEGNVPEAYDDSAEYYMTKKNYFDKVIALVDANKQPIARVSVGIDGKPAYNILGRPVTFVPAEYLGDNLLVVGDLSDYILNSNLQLTMKKYYDDNTDEWINKATLLADGNLASDQSFQVIKLGA